MRGILASGFLKFCVVAAFIGSIGVTFVSEGYSASPKAEVSVPKNVHPIKFTSEILEIDSKKKTAIFRGNVKVILGIYELQAKTIVLKKPNGTGKIKFHSNEKVDVNMHLSKKNTKISMSGASFVIENLSIPIFNLKKLKNFTTAFYSTYAKSVTVYEDESRAVLKGVRIHRLTTRF
jgi:lipopolysaccharide assembly outer membrane protein LptD (OstA)